MTATVPRQGPPTSGGPTRVRLDARPGTIYCYDVLDAATGVKVEGDYVGQARDPVRRDKQHRGQLPQRDGVVREQPWADLIVGGQRILEQGVWTDAELDGRELAWMAHLSPRLNDTDNRHNPQRIPIYTQRQQRDGRDIAAGLAPRDWSRPASATVPNRPVPSTTVRPPSWLYRAAGRSVRWAGRRLRAAAVAVLPWLAVWTVLAVVLVVWADMPAGRDATGVALAGTAAAWGLVRWLGKCCRDLGNWWRWATGQKRPASRTNRRRTR